MSGKPLRLASVAGAERMATAARRVADAWRARWELDGVQVTVTGRVWDAEAPPAVDQPGQWLHCMAPARGMLFWPNELEALVADQLYPRSPEESPPREGSIASSSARHAVEDLRRMLHQHWFNDGVPVKAGAFLPMSRWDAFVAVEMVIGRQQVVAIVVDAGANQPVPGLPLAPVPQQSFHATPVRLQLVVGHADIALPDAAALQIGDVIILDARLTDPLELRVEGAQPVLHACLGHVGPRRALQIVSPTPTHGVLQ